MTCVGQNLELLLSNKLRDRIYSCAEEIFAQRVSRENDAKRAKSGGKPDRPFIDRAHEL
jgi:hypothetical protein